MPRTPHPHCAALALAMIAATPAPGLAQTAYPTRPVRFIVPYPPGGTTDPMARLAATKLAEKFQQPVIVDNRPGGNTIIGTEAVARAPADGYTWLLASPAFMNTPSLVPKVSFDPVRDFAGVATISKTRSMLVVPASSPANTLQEMIAYAKSRSGQLTYASSGVGANTHLSGAYFNLLLGTRMNHVPYKGGGALHADLMTGRVDLAFQSPMNVLSHVRSGKMKALAISGDARVAALPDVPTFREGGMADFVLDSWQGIVVPRGTPNAPIDRIARELAAALKQPDTQEYLAKLGAEPMIATPEQTTALIKADFARNAKIIRDAGIRME